jgi:hypothetical protein
MPVYQLFAFFNCQTWENKKAPADAGASFCERNAVIRITNPACINFRIINPEEQWGRGLL